MFKDIRQSLLPGIVQREYAAAKTAFDQQDPESADQFERVLKLLDDPLLDPRARVDRPANGGVGVPRS